MKLSMYMYTKHNIYSPWRACGSWPVPRRNPPHWPSGGQRQNSCLCSHRAFACSCASWRVFHTAPGNAGRSREDRVKGKWRKHVSNTDKTYLKDAVISNIMTPSVKKQATGRNDHFRSFIAFKKPTYVKVSKTKHWMKKGQGQSNVPLQ